MTRCGFCEKGKYTFKKSNREEVTIECPYCDGTGWHKEGDRRGTTQEDQARKRS